MRAFGAGDRARFALSVSAAARQWNVSESTLRTSAGVVHHDASGRRATYGSLVAVAATLPVPQHAPLKSPDRFTLIGKTTTHRIDIPIKLNGKAEYGIDVRVPGMQYAAIARSPVFGGRVKSFDATKAKAVPGVTHVVQVSNGVAVVGKNMWVTRPPGRLHAVHAALVSRRLHEGDRPVRGFRRRRRAVPRSEHAGDVRR